MSGPRITIVGGGSTHWTPRLLVDFANTLSLRDAEITLMDIAPQSLPPMVNLAEHIAKVREVGLVAHPTTSLDEALEGADFVVTALSVGGFSSMRHDLEIPARHGIRQPVGDSVGPGGIFRALRMAPVVADVARTMEQRCPEALLVNVSNPLTALCRAAVRESRVRVVGLCNELVGLKFTMSLLFDAPMHEVDPVAGGVNHLPLVTGLRIGGEDGFEKLRSVFEDGWSQGGDPIWMPPAEVMHWQKVSGGETWTKADVVHNNRVKFELFRRFGVLPGASDVHIVEFFPGFLTAASDFGRDWGIHHYGLAGHVTDKINDDAQLSMLMTNDEMLTWPSGELVAELLDGVVTGTERQLPVNIPNRGQVANLPEDRVVECIGVTGPFGVQARDRTEVTSVLGEYLRQVSASQELTVEAALAGDRTRLLEAMLTDQLAGHLPYEEVVSLTDEMLAATSQWLPRFSGG